MTKENVMMGKISWTKKKKVISITMFQYFFHLVTGVKLTSYIKKTKQKKTQPYKFISSGRLLQGYP